MPLARFNPRFTAIGSFVGAGIIAGAWVMVCPELGLTKTSAEKPPKQSIVNRNVFRIMGNREIAYQLGLGEFSATPGNCSGVH